jgi:hypothetical protein
VIEIVHPVVHEGVLIAFLGFKVVCQPTSNKRTKNVKDQKWRETRQSKYDKTVKTTTLIQAQSYKVVEKWEYHFRKSTGYGPIFFSLPVFNLCRMWRPCEWLR